MTDSTRDSRAHWRIDEMERRLQEGNKTFESIRSEIKARAWVRWVQVLGALGLIGSIAFAAGSYPDRGEFDKAIDGAHERLDRVQDVTHQMQLEQTKQGRDLDTLKRDMGRYMESIDGKLDNMLEQGQRRRR